ncbi:hypothetical protein DIPPA_31416 [Diplonema papillatum]|nr:hypothetical protein DIPPA_31416 [Diplonema papillatum]
MSECSEHKAEPPDNPDGEADAPEQQPLSFPPQEFRAAAVDGEDSKVQTDMLCACSLHILAWLYGLLTPQGQQPLFPPR